MQLLYTIELQKVGNNSDKPGLKSVMTSFEAASPEAILQALEDEGEAVHHGPSVKPPSVNS